MIEENFDATRLINQGQLFSIGFEDPTRYAYHGTSCLNSPFIECEGLLRERFSIAPELLKSLAATRHKQCPQNTEFFIGDPLLLAAEKSTRVSCAPYSYIAAHHALSMKGGQVAKHCRNAILDGARPEVELIRILNEFDTNHVCVYAIDLTGYSLPNIIFEHGVFLSRVDIPISSIVAKVIIPFHFEEAQLDIWAQKKPKALASINQGSLAQKLNRINMNC